MNLTVLQRISCYNFVYFSLVYVLPPNDRVLCSFVIMEGIPTSKPLINLTLWCLERWRNAASLTCVGHVQVLLPPQHDLVALSLPS